MMVVHLAGWMAAYLEKQMVEQRVGLMGQLKVVHWAEWKVEQWVGDSGILLVGRLAVDSVVQMVEKMVLKLVGWWAVLRVKWWG